MVAYNEEGNAAERALTLLMSPFIGLAYVVALPFISIATLAVLAARKCAEAVFDLVGGLVSFGWRPGEAYLGGKKKKHTRKGGRHS